MHNVSSHQKHITTSDSRVRFPIRVRFQDLKVVTTDGFPTRLRELIGNEPVAAFGRRCGVSEALIRAYLQSRKRPGMDRLIAIANTAGVNIDWLATGRGPKYQAQQAPPPQRPPDLQLLPGGGQRLTGAELEASIERRLDVLREILACIDDEARRATILDELLSRAQEVKRLDELEQAVEKLLAAQKPKD